MMKMSKSTTAEKEFVVIPAAPRDKSKVSPYVKKKTGIPVPEGMTFQDLSTEQRQEVLLGQENAWRKEYNKKRSTISTIGTLTRG